MSNLNHLQPSIWAILILIILATVATLLINEVPRLGFRFTLLTTLLILGLIYIVLPYMYSKNITCVSSEMETKQISLLPNQTMTTDSYIFIVDTKELKTEKTKDTIYKKDSNLEPYIVVEKSTYKAPYKWYISKSSVDEVNNQSIYILKEVHY